MKIGRNILLAKKFNNIGIFKVHSFKKIVIVVLVFLIFASNISCRLIPSNEISKAELAGKNQQPSILEFEDVTLNLFSGGEIKISDLKGKLVLLNFWASWCPPCRWEMPYFEVAWNEYKDQGIVFIGIAQDLDVNDAKEFANSTGVTYPLGLDPGNRLSRDLDVLQLPTTIILDKDGKVTKRITKSVGEKLLNRILNQVLREQDNE